nr:uncharacterized protein LOC112440502 [Pan paniscus]
MEAAGTPRTHGSGSRDNRLSKGAPSVTPQGRAFADTIAVGLWRRQRRGCSPTSLGRYGAWGWAVFSSEWGLMMIIPHLLRDKDQRATTATSPRTRQCWGTENEGVQLWPSQSSGGDETHLPLSLWARLMPGASVDRGHAPGLPKLEKAARLRSEGQNSTVSPTESRWEQGGWLPRLCGRIRFLAVEVACTPQLVLPVSNYWSFLLLSLHLPPSPITCSALTRIRVESCSVIQASSGVILAHCNVCLLGSGDSPASAS